MLVEMWDIDRVRPYEGNPRVISDAAIKKVAASLKKFGWRQPLVVDAAGIIIVGHTRRLAAKSLGWSKAPVHVATDLAPDQVRAYRLADNRVGEETDWLNDKLRVEFEALQGEGFDLDITGFDPGEIDSILALPGDEAEEDDGADESELGYTIQYNIIFDDEDQQGDWYSFIRHLKTAFPDSNTLGERLQKFIREGGYGSD